MSFTTLGELPLSVTIFITHVRILRNDVIAVRRGRTI